jgi:hypothetical protein
MSRHVRLLAWLVAGAVTSACATPPPAASRPPATSPAAPVAGLSELVGAWKGTLSGPGFDGPFTQTIEPDGRYTAVLSFGTFTGTITLREGTLRGRADQTGSTGTYALQEENGARVLVYQSDDGMYAAKLKRTR